MLHHLPANVTLLPRLLLFAKFLNNYLANLDHFIATFRGDLSAKFAKTLYSEVCHFGSNSEMFCSSFLTLDMHHVKSRQS